VKIKYFLIILNIGLSFNLLEEHFALWCLWLGFCTSGNVYCAASSLLLLVDLSSQLFLLVKHVSSLYLVQAFKSEQGWPFVRPRYLSIFLSIMFIILDMLPFRNVNKQLFELVNWYAPIHSPLRLVLQELLHHLLLVFIPVLAHFAIDLVVFFKWLRLDIWVFFWFQRRIRSLYPIWLHFLHKLLLGFAAHMIKNFLDYVAAARNVICGVDGSLLLKWLYLLLLVNLL
jgi:hypothetical protein